MADPFLPCGVGDPRRPKNENHAQELPEKTTTQIIHPGGLGRARVARRPAPLRAASLRSRPFVALAALQLARPPTPKHPGRIPSIVNHPPGPKCKGSGAPTIERAVGAGE